MKNSKKVWILSGVTLFLILLLGLLVFNLKKEDNDNLLSSRWVEVKNHTYMIKSLENEVNILFVSKINSRPHFVFMISSGLECKNQVDMKLLNTVDVTLNNKLTKFDRMCINQMLGLEDLTLTFDKSNDDFISEELYNGRDVNLIIENQNKYSFGSANYREIFLNEHK